MMHSTLSIWILSAVICVGTGDHHLVNPHDDHEIHQETALDGSAKSDARVTAANKEFAFRLYRKLAAHADSQGKNIFFSPASVSVALAALAVGARGDTHQQLFSGLGFNSTLLTQADVDQAFQTLFGTANKASNEEISEGTAAFVDSRISAQAAFQETLKQSYFADWFNTDFTKPTDSANAINEYVKEKTNGKIEKMVDKLDPSTVMYLISYIYFKGMWATPFDPMLTKDDTFMVDENTKVPVQMMNMEKSFQTYYDQAINTSVLHLPFNSSYSMLLLLPGDMATLENVICPAHVTKWLKWMRSRTYDVHVPKFSIQTSYLLKEVLTEMGMTDMFGDRADLSGIAEEQKLVVSEVGHKATLDVDEAGATASATTGIHITLMSFQHVPVLKFDHPFMIIINDHKTDKILFMGKIINPNI